MTRLLDAQTPPSTVRILLVDDHPLIRDGLKSRLQTRSDWQVVGEADTTEDAIELIRELRPDVVIVDLSLKRGSGLDLIKHVSGMADAPKVLVCSMHEETLYAQRVLQAGAMGFVHKQHASEQIVPAVSRILSGRLHVSEAVAEQLMAHVTRHPAGTDPSSVACLTDRELEVLEAIGRGSSAQQIANDLHLSVKTIETYRERAKKKLGLRTSSELLRFAVLNWNDPQRAERGAVELR
jgi:DNA-binding NarL/FixJ family response regulator